MGTLPVLARRASVAALASMVVVSPTRTAAENLRDVPLGGRTAAMGGAAVAAGVDAAMPVLNPAGVGGTPHDVLSVSANVYSGLGAAVDGYHAPDGLGARYGDARIEEDVLDQKHLAVMPSAVTYFRRFGADDDPYRHVLALSVMSPSFSQLDISGRFRASGSTHRLGAETLAQDRFRQIFAGPTYALTAWNRRLRFGVSVFATYADLVADVHRFSFSADQSAGAHTVETTNERTIVDTTSVGLTTVLGGQLRLFDAVWIGAAAEARGLSLWGTGTTVHVDDRARADASGAASTQSRFEAKGDLDDVSISRPLRISAGLALDRPNGLALAADVHFIPAHAGFREWSGTERVTRVGGDGDVAVTDEAVNHRRGTRDTVNFSLGAEVHVTRKVSVRAGVLTDRDVAEERSRGEAVPNDRLDWTVFTVGVGHSIGPVGTSYGVAYRRGDGTAFVRDVFGSDPSRVAEIAYTAHGIMLMLSGAVTTDDEDDRRRE